MRLPAACIGWPANVSLADRLPVAGTTLGSSSTSLVTPRPPLGVLLILQRASTHAPAGREEDEHGDDNQDHRHEQLQNQHCYPYLIGRATPDVGGA